MYRYDHYDQTLVEERVRQFRDQTRRFLAGALSEDEYRPLRLMNGLYMERWGPMLRVAIPYGTLSSTQLRMLAQIARTYDRGFGHFTTRQNIQYHWLKLEEVPEVLAALARVQMHAIQTSGNCVRNITSDPLAGVTPDEIEDPRPYCEILRQWSTLHPEFAYLPRKFKIALTGARHDRAATAVHDIGYRMTRAPSGETGFRVIAGGGQGRTPQIGVVIREFLPKQDLLSYTEAILRVYNRFGRRDNKYKARIKVLVNALGAAEFTRRVEAEWRAIADSVLTLRDADVKQMRARFDTFTYDPAAAADHAVTVSRAGDRAFTDWTRQNTRAHRVPGYRAVYVSLKHPDRVPGDATDVQMDALAALADEYSFGEIRVTHGQNLVLADVREAALEPLWRALRDAGLATANIGLLTDIICCPGIDFCSLANAGSIPVAAEINRRFADAGEVRDIGELRINMSGCVNACGHHHVGHIGILGVDKQGAEFYQLTLGGSAGDDAALGERLGPAVPKDEVVGVIAALIDVYRARRQGGETFLATLRRTGIEPFRQRVYGDAGAAREAA